MSTPEDQRPRPEEPAGEAPPESASPYPESAEPAYHSSSAHDGFSGYDDPYYDGTPYDSTQPGQLASSTEVVATPAAAVATSTGGGSAPPPVFRDDSEEEEDPDDQGMLRMSFLEHLEELRTRLIRMVMGLGVAFIASLTFTNELWRFVSAPAVDALHQLGYTGNDAKLAQITPMEAFSTIWVKLPLLTSIFLASPWILYQIWAFIAPGLYKKERRLAGPFIMASAGLFILGGLFAYFVAFRFGLVFLLGIGRDENVRAVVSITEYFDLFVNVILGISVVFELPVLIFLLTLLRILSPRWLLGHSRYAILAIVLLAAVITPTPDIFNLMIFSVPMVLLYFIGVFASFLLVRRREGKSFPWPMVLAVVGGLIAVGGTAIGMAVTQYGYRFVNYWPFLVK